MKQALFALVLFFLIAFNAMGQVSRTVTTTSKTNIKKELFKYLVATKQADKADEYNVMYQIDLLSKASTPGIGIYKFGLESPHAGYNVVFQYRDKLVFPTSITTGHLLTLFGNFLTQYPKSYSLSDQQKIAERLIGVVEHQEYLAKQDL